MDVSLAITTCGRFDLLHSTLTSLASLTLDKIGQFVMVDDSGDENVARRLDNLYSDKFKIIHNNPKEGLSKSIDKLYKICRHEYIFHCEDDWLFDGSNQKFISDSLKILKNRPDIHQIWLRHQSDTPHKADKEVLKLGNIRYQLIPQWGEWNGFSWNPGLRRKSDYKQMFPNGFSEVGDELSCAEHAGTQGYKVATLLDTVCTHIGYGRHTEGFIH